MKKIGRSFSDVLAGWQGEVSKGLIEELRKGVVVEVDSEVVKEIGVPKIKGSEKEVGRIIVKIIEVNGKVKLAIWLKK